MSKFHPLRVTDIHHETRNSVVVTLLPADDIVDEFAFTQGQYLTFRKAFDDEELRRSYSICAGRADGVLRVGIKKVEDGWFSTWANEELQVGDTVDVMPPKGNFFVPLDPANAKNYLCFAGGSGITPILSIIKTTLAEEPHSVITLVYGNQSSNTIMFREELEDLKSTNLGRLTIVHILERESQDIDLFNGLVDAEKCAALFKYWIDVSTVDVAFVCGPKPMMLAVADALKEHGLDESQIKFELFASAKRGLGRKGLVEALRKSNKADKCEATVILSGVSRVFDMPKQGQTILEAALAEGLDVPYACQSGVCSTCRARIVEGETEMDANFALEDYEVRQGFALTCQCYPLNDRVVVDYDQ